MEKGKSGLILWVTYPGGRMPSLLWVTYPGNKKMENGLILMGDLPKWKKEEWSHSLGDLPMGRNGLILMGDLPK